ncbi:hypothetical protein KAFR_0C03660 [Kazachstania africana CBS 2517]|uniref:Zn(2)-C6 fungal-type domain-containing protein n=1 Tax=Kazachstania africana (strain ATCC 22294 / BCRC 22015 / CBS 2517 / CECT 1963 / NBRC 1671 / NRRL Y-8276) TaxID=1071382 RepID=H2ASK8_KAZAF|nr:hypothetical protein KAFR_0C03660 [Kazachstania africana CBS 2517]CCF57358.1 hypothetical protein KAFR_0C03660 [Kazachstania africana CBS 2517]
MIEKDFRKIRPSYVCVTCRTQKLKCDKQRPSCGRCLKNKRKCVYEINSSLDSLHENSMRSHSNNQISPASSSGHSNATLIENSISSPEALTLTLDTSRIKGKQADNLDLWDPRDMYLSHGYQTYYDFPFGPHSMGQYDPYTRLFCSSVHGSTLTDIQNRLSMISNDLSNSGSNLSTTLVDPSREISPLAFIEKAVIKWVQNASYDNNQIPTDYFDSVYTIGDRMHPKLILLIERLISEISSLLFDKTKTEILLQRFYEDVYPFYPLIEIDLFENSLKKLLEVNTEDRYKINVFGENIRLNLEYLTQFLSIMVVTLRNPSLREQVPTKLALERAQQLQFYAQRLLSLLNGFKYTSEKILCSSLYLFISEYLNPENPEMHITHNFALTLKCLNELSTTLGLFQEPSQFTRCFNTEMPSDSYFLFRRKLWIGLQSIKLQLITADGGCTEQDYKYLNMFIRPKNRNSSSLLPVSFSRTFNPTIEIDKYLFDLSQNKYQLHVLLVQLMNSCSPETAVQNLSVIIENIKQLEEFTECKFPLSKLDEQEDFLLTECTCYNAKFNVKQIENVEILQANILILSSLMNIYNVLMNYFEKKASIEWPEYQNLYHAFFIELINCYLRVLKLVVVYMSGNYSKVISSKHEYVLNKFVSFVMIKIWTIQMSFSLRLSYRRDIMERLNVVNQEDIGVISRLLNSVQDHIQMTVDTITRKFDEQYFGLFQVTLMTRYLIYLIDIKALSKVTNKYWKRAQNDIPEKIIDKITMKWGVSPQDSDYIDYYTHNPEPLSRFTSSLLEKIELLFSSHKIIVRADVPVEVPPGKNAYGEVDSLAPFLESHFDLFSSIIDDNMGELPTI